MFNALNPMRQWGQPQIRPVQGQVKPMPQAPVMRPTIAQPGMGMQPQIRPVNALAGVKYGLR